MGILRVATMALIAAAVLAGGAGAAAAAPATTEAALRPVGTPLGVVVMPVRLRGERAPSSAQLQGMLRRAGAMMDRASYGRIRLAGVVAPPVRAGRFETSPRVLDPAVFAYAMRRAVERGVRFNGAVPVFVAASRTPTASYGSPSQVLIQGTGWRQPTTLPHELGHALGLDHAIAPTACPRPFRPLACADRPRQVFEYGDAFDLMGYGADRFGAYALAVLGLAVVADAPQGRTVTAVRPVDGPRPTLLRLRTAGRDWYVESRRRAARRGGGRARPPAGVEVSRVGAAYVPPAGDGLYPRPMRLPATDPAVACASDRSCLARQVLTPGRSLTVPGAFRLTVLPGRAGAPARVATTWLDRVPPTAAIRSATVVVPPGGAAEIVLGIASAARGAGVLAVEVGQGGIARAIPADDVPGLATRGRGTVRVPREPGAASVRLVVVDAAGNRSAAAAVDLTAVPVAPGATVAFDPPLGAHRPVAVPLAGGRPVTVSGITDPALAGLSARLEVADSAGGARIPVAIGPGGAFSVSWTPSAPGLHRLRVVVPVGRAANGIGLRTIRRVGWVRT